MFMHHYQHLHPSRQRQGRHGKESRELHDGRDGGCWKGATRPTTMGRLFLNQTLRGRTGGGARAYCSLYPLEFYSEASEHL